MNLARKTGLKLRQSYMRVGKQALIEHQRYAHAKQFKRARKAPRNLKTYLGRTVRDIRRQIGDDETLRAVFPAIKREMRWRSAIEPVIGHLKAEHRVGRNYLAGKNGDAINAALTAAGYNFSLLLNWFRQLLWLLLAWLLAGANPRAA